MNKTVSGGPHVIRPHVSDQPFSAKVEMTFEQFGKRRGGFVARDSYGRTRYEILFAPGVSAISITDPVREVRYMLSPATKGLTVIAYPRAQQMWSEKGTEPDTPADDEKRMIEGLECYRFAFQLRGGEHGEQCGNVTAWISPRVGLVEEEAIEAGQKNTWRLYDISLSEPDPELFEPPSGPNR